MEELTLQASVGDAVDGIAEHRQVDRRQVHADLVGHPRLEPHAQQGMRTEQAALRPRVVIASPRRVRVERPPRRVLAVAADRRVDPMPGTRPPRTERQVGPLEGVLATRFCNRLYASSERATTRRPDVPRRADARFRAGRCPPLRLARARAAVVRVPGSCPGAGARRRRPACPRRAGCSSRRRHAGRPPRKRARPVSAGQLNLDCLPALQLPALDGLGRRAARLRGDQPLGGTTRPDLGQLGQETVQPRPGGASGTSGVKRRHGRGRGRWAEATAAPRADEDAEDDEAVREVEGWPDSSR